MGKRFMQIMSFYYNEHIYSCDSHHAEYYLWTEAYPGRDIETNQNN